MAIPILSVVIFDTMCGIGNPNILGWIFEMCDPDHLGGASQTPPEFHPERKISYGRKIKKGLILMVVMGTVSR